MLEIEPRQVGHCPALKDEPSLTLFHCDTPGELPELSLTWTGLKLQALQKSSVLQLFVLQWATVVPRYNTPRYNAGLAITQFFIRRKLDQCCYLLFKLNADLSVLVTFQMF